MLCSWIEDIPIVGALLNGIIPGLALVIFLALLPPIICAMLNFAGRISKSQIDFGLITRFFVFQIFTTFLGSFITGSIANQFKQLIEDPGSIIDILGTAAPQTAIFFTSFVLVEGMISGPIQFLRIVGLLIFWLKSSVASTDMARERIIKENHTEYGKEIPYDTIAMLLGLTFCCIFPIIAPAVVIYASTTYVMKKYSLCYVDTTAYQTGGAFWPQIFFQLITGLVMYQGVMIAILAIKESIATPFIVLPLPFLTLLFAKVVDQTFFPSLKTLSMIAAAARDADDDRTPKHPTTRLEHVQEAYMSPSFKFE